MNLEFGLSISCMSVNLTASPSARNSGLNSLRQVRTRCRGARSRGFRRYRQKRPSGMMMRHGALTFHSDSMHRNNRRACTCPATLASWREALQPAPHTRAVTAINVAELALEIGFLVGHYAVADDERKGHQHYQQPEIVESDGQADQTQEHAEVDGVAREAVRPALDDGGGRQVGGDV